VSRLLAEGRAPEVERFRAEAAIARAEADLAELDAATLAGTHELARLVGVDGGALPLESLRPVGLMTPDPGPAATGRVSSSDSGSPELESARSQLRAAEAERNVAAAAWLPRLLLSGGLRSYGSGEGDFTAEWQGGIGVEYPLFTGFARSREVAAASAEETAAREDLRATELAMADRADRAIEAVRGAAASADALASAERHLAEVVRIERLSLVEGAGVQTDYLQAEAELAETRAARARAVNLHVAARAELARARGELTPEWIRRNLESLP
jgi:outer membrane protein TolC